MKKTIAVIILSSTLLSFCTKDDKPEADLTVHEFYNYCAASKTRCGNALNHEGSYVSISGYVQALNTFEDDGRFHIFDSASMSSARVEIKVVGDNSAIFEKLNNNLDAINYSNFSICRVVGKIVGKDLPINGACLRGAFLEIKSSSDILVIPQ
jgi:hypothetical protein